MNKKVVLLNCCKVMGRANLFQLLLLFLLFVIAAEGAVEEYNTIMILQDEWEVKPPSWVGADPCGNWEGITCTNSSITTLALADMGLKGELPTDIVMLSELQILNLAFNEYLTGQLRASIGNLTNLKTLILDGCRFSGPIPATIGSLKQLTYLSLKNNRFSGPIPPSIGNLANLIFLDLSDNMLGGSIPVSNGTAPGLDMLNRTKHFHFSSNQLSGSIPPQLFSSNMSLVHLIFDRNNFTGSIPSTIGLVKTLEAVLLYGNSLSGPVPSSLSNLTNVSELQLSNNKLTGPVPNLTLMDSLHYVDMSNNTFDASDVPNWFSTLESLTTLMMENTGLQGQVPQALFSLQDLETVVLKNNALNGRLDIGTNYSNQLNLIDLQKNSIADLAPIGEGYIYTLILVDNPVCEGSQNNLASNFCNVSPPSPDSSISTTPSNCTSCRSGQVPSPNCKCASPYTRTLVFLFVSFSNLDNINHYEALSNNLTRFFQSKNLPVDSVSLSHPSWSSAYQLEIMIEIFPSGDQVSFNKTETSAITSVLSNQTLEGRPKYFGPYSFLVLYTNSGGSNQAVVIGISISASVLFLLLVLVGLYALQQKRKADKSLSGSILLTGISNGSASGPQLKGARLFSFEELQKCTNGFSEANDIGSGGYGQVYKGILPTGQMLAIKRAKRESMQGGVEFKAEIELLSRVHHKNLVGLVGFCFEKGEQILVYEYVPNGDLRDTLSGKSGIRLDWMRRLQVALGAARGLAYLHELANPTIIHRDIKSNNILLDKDLNAKVADFGLSKSIADSRMDHLSTQVKGTLGYLDPEYYMTQQLTDKSDVYSFGVVMLELITARRPIVQGQYIVRVVQMRMDKSKDLYNLDDILDPFIGLGTELKGLEMFVDLAMSCVEELRDKRPRMGEVVKQIENIIQIAALNASTNPLSTSARYEEFENNDSTEDLYSRPFDYSGVFGMKMEI